MIFLALMAPSKQSLWKVATIGNKLQDELTLNSSSALLVKLKEILDFSFVGKVFLTFSKIGYFLGEEVNASLATFIRSSILFKLLCYNIFHKCTP